MAMSKFNPVLHMNSCMETCIYNALQVLINLLRVK